MKVREAWAQARGQSARRRIRLQQWEAATQAIDEAEPLAVEMDAKDQLPELWRGRALIHLARGETDQARELIEKTITLCHDLGLKVDEGMGWRSLGQVFTASRQLDRANEAFTRSLALVHDDGYEVARTQAAWGQALLESDHARTVSLLREARATFERLGTQRDVLAIHLV